MSQCMPTVGSLYLGPFNPLEQSPLPLDLPPPYPIPSHLTVGDIMIPYHSLFLSLLPQVPHSRYIYTTEYYSATRSNDMGFESKWMQLEDIMLSEISQDQKHKRCRFSLTHGRQIQR
jgi:hypothetical protein